MVALLGCRVLSGSFEEVAAADNRIVLTETMARQLFGRIDVCGESVCHIQKWRQLLYTVGAVVEDCRGKSNLHYDFISPLWVEDYERNSAVHENFRIMVRTSRPERTESELSRVDIKIVIPWETGADPFTYVSQDGRRLRFCPGLLLPTGVCSGVFAIGVECRSESVGGLHVYIFRTNP